nr:unnamed protein product [Callosobruchus analis]
MNLSFTLPAISIITLLWLEKMATKKSQKISSKSKASTMSRHDVLKLVPELPSWVLFPDRERAEWLNEIIAQLWPSISSHLVKRFRGPLQTNVRKRFDSFRFESVDFGPTVIDVTKYTISINNLNTIDIKICRRRPNEKVSRIFNRNVQLLFRLSTHRF